MKVVYVLSVYFREHMFAGTINNPQIQSNRIKITDYKNMRICKYPLDLKLSG